MRLDAETQLFELSRLNELHIIYQSAIQTKNKKIIETLNNPKGTFLEEMFKYAVWHHDEELLDLYLKSGGDINQEPEGGGTLLQRYMYGIHHANIVIGGNSFGDYLLSKGADINFSGNIKQTPAFLLCKADQVKSHDDYLNSLQYLIDIGGDIKQKNNDESGLQQILFKNSRADKLKSSFELLAKNGITINTLAEDEQIEIIAHIIISYCNDYFGNEENSSLDSIRDFFSDLNLNFDVEDNEGNNLIAKISSSSRWTSSRFRDVHINVIKYLMTHGCQIDKENSKDLSALDYLSFIIDDDIIDELIIFERKIFSEQDSLKDNSHFEDEGYRM